MKIRDFALMAALAAVASSCGDAEFKVSGEVYGGEGKTVILEKSDFYGRWIPVDSTHIGNNGQFSIKSDAPASPDIYRLALGDRFIYFPVDSIESLKVTSDAADFGVKFSLEGTPQAERMAQFEKSLQKLDMSVPDSVESFKRRAYMEYIRDGKGSIVSYYVLTKTLGGKSLFNPEDPSDAKYYAAVATQFQEFRPSDPHGPILRDVSLQAMKNRNRSQGKRMVIEASETKVLDIELQNEKGENTKLSDIIGKGKRVVVAFAMMNLPESPDFNRRLSEIRSSKGVEIYHISFDTDHYAWRDAARNLPWITVIDPGGMSSDALVRYNVGSLPAFFIYDAGGELVDRASDLKELSKKL